jgi:hypothetical protein
LKVSCGRRVVSEVNFEAIEFTAHGKDPITGVQAAGSCG